MLVDCPSLLCLFDISAQRCDSLHGCPTARAGRNWLGVTISITYKTTVMQQGKVATRRYVT